MVSSKRKGHPDFETADAGKKARLSSPTAAAGSSVARPQQVDETTANAASTSQKGGSSTMQNGADMASDGFTMVKSKQDKAREKKMKGKEKAKRENAPQFMFNTDGFRHNKKIGIAHIRDLILHLVTEFTSPNWILAQNRSSISHTVVILATGLLPADLGVPPVHVSQNMPFPILPQPSSEYPPTTVPVLHKLFSHACPTRAPGDQKRVFSVLDGLLKSPLSDKERQRREKEKDTAWKKYEESGGAKPSLYLLTPNQMLDNDYPLPEWMELGEDAYVPGVKGPSRSQDEKSKAYEKLEKQNLGRKGQGEGWIETARSEVEEGSVDLKVVAIDCEMCLTENGTNELTRITLVDYGTGNVLMDELCKPDSPIKDYLTQFSGITAEKLATATHNLATIQAKIVDEGLIDAHTILLGHSLDSDLAALKLRHSLCIDTALLYKHARGPPFKPALKYLVTKHLAREIQNGGEKGHDSEEDARACIDLLRMKLIKGPDFGDPAMESESIFDKMARHASNSARPGKSAAICDYGKTMQWHGQKAKTAVTCSNDEEVVNAVIENVQNHDFVFGRFMEVNKGRNWWANPAAETEKETNDLEPPKPDSEAQAMQQFNDRLQRLHDALPINTAFILLTGQGDPRPFQELIRRQGNFDRLYKRLGADGVSQLKGEDRWTAQDDRDLQQAVEVARFGMAFFCVK